MCSNYSSSIYVHTNPSVSSDHNNLQYYYNGGPMSNYSIPKLSINNVVYCIVICEINPYRKLSRMERGNTF